MSGAHCINNEEHSSQLETLTECQRLCLERDNCIGVSFSAYHASTDGSSHCYFCEDAVTTTESNYDVYLMPGNP